ncbi:MULTISPECIES: microbial rhodopsin family protein [unclassified Leptolyngbya]|uniref:bacteriorhodopsin n=1 Tax=unclassified Leptolyngbya TaxID=2650499 RepID=UPI001686FDCB|nr:MULTISPECIES: microbial rhodopsin family protein [unclassified Leptolyngbya]MBD1912555.1 bacteriorhodopsin [Leptolyngbya sp. FACHB-8]MBD2154908.1 bacteriorhodopsin [Leptolyngbya sp. FACHB-16]
MVQTWLWTGVISMALGSVLFGFGAAQAQSERWKILFILNFFICVIAAGLYLAMAMGQGQSEVYGRPTFWVRYVTWFMSTPLLLLDLAFLGRSTVAVTGSLLGANTYMILTGFAATMSPKPINYVWYVVSCAAFLATLYLLVKPYRIEAERKHPRSRKVFRKLLSVHVILWTLYPVVWILSSTGLSILSQGYETMGYTLLDIASKVGFGLLSLNSLKQIEQAGERQPTREFETSAI